MWKHCPFATDCPRSVLWRLLEHGGGQSRPFHRDTHIMKHKINPTRYNWKPVVASFLLHMRERGFECIIVNNGGGSYDELVELMTAVREEVFKAAEIMLEPEIKIYPKDMTLADNSIDLETAEKMRNLKENLKNEQQMKS